MSLPHCQIQFEAYTVEKDARNIKETAVILEDMFRNFPQETQLWHEVKTYSDALQSEASDEKTVFYKNVFAAFPTTLQYHILVNVAETTKDVLRQCQLMLLILGKYPEQVPTQGMKLIDLLLSTEKQHQSPPVNCYRKYLGDLQSPTSQRSFSSAATKKILIPGLTEKESYIEKPWEQLFSLLETIGKLLEWDMSGLFGNTKYTIFAFLSV
ncbi:hypothetical protein LSH36_28g03027 [Paralvinella palmiformis]|uniref:Integrator complex subunit 10 n=1 Tax=Paralvinella palmiformis TaxID=53620 RepID=A0AAD9KA76_9ANNE|nr:hypothetical protein LSH36_28g03027 [Paralvinella palmiformis]